MGKRKDNRGKRRRGIWVLGIISEEERGRVVLESIEGRDIDSIIPIILKHVAPGTTIKTDCLATYHCLQYLPSHPALAKYKHVTVNHSKELVCAYTGININLIEGTWPHFKRSLPSGGLHSDKTCYAGYLYQFAYQRLVGYQYPGADPFLVFLRHWGELIASGGNK